MGITKNAERQEPICAYVDVSAADLAGEIVEKTVSVGYAALTSGAAYDTGLALPVGAVVVSGEVDILTPFNSQTSDVVVVGDATVANRYVASSNIHTGATTPIPFVPTGFVVTGSQPTLKITWTKVGTAPSAGALSITVRYRVAADAAAIELPPNAVVLSGGVTVTEAFDSSVSDVLDIGDSASEARYADDVDLTTLGRTELVPTGYRNTTGASITARWTGLGDAPTQGAFRLDVKYYVEGRAAFTQN